MKTGTDDPYSSNIKCDLESIVEVKTERIEDVLKEETDILDLKTEFECAIVKPETSEHFVEEEKDPLKLEPEEDASFLTPTTTKSKRPKIDWQRFTKSEVGHTVMFCCDQCDYKTTQKCNLRNHLESIHEGTEYACKQCNFRCNFLGNLKKHVQNKHEDHRYFCTQCEYQAKNQGTLKRHVQSVHEGVKYACSQCDYQGSKDGLRFHVKKHY